MKSVLIIIKYLILSLIGSNRNVVYISGAITSAGDNGKDMFGVVDKRLDRKRYIVINPYELFKNSKCHLWYYYMRIDIIIMMLMFRKSDSGFICMLPTYKYSQGSLAELQLARSLKLKILFLNHDLIIENGVWE